MEELIKWLDDNKICYQVLDKEVIELEGFGKLFLADLSGVQSIFRGTKDELCFNLMERPEILIEEGINYVAFPFGRNWYYYDLREDFKFNILKYVGKRKASIIKTSFVNLGMHTPYELLNSSGDVSLWVKKAKLLGHTALGICDRNTLAATLTLQKECAKAGIKHVFGYSFTMEQEEEKIDVKIYCQTQKGLRNLLRIHKEIMVDSPVNTISINDLLKYAEGNVLVLGNKSSYWMQENLHILVILKKAFDGLYYQVDLSEYKAERIDAQVLMAAKYYFDNFYHKDTDSFSVEPVLICDNYYLDKDESKSKIILNKIASGAAHEQSDDQYFKDVEDHFNTINSVFSTERWDKEKLFERMCANTVKIAENAEAHYELGKMYMPQYIMLDEERAKYGNRRRMFLDLLDDGLKSKIEFVDHEQYRKRLDEEIYIIESTNNVDYFLIQWDMINEARKRGIATGIGRGSAGGSLVSYLLGIISIDPIKYNLIFSRFLVPERCGLHWMDELTVIGSDMELRAEDEYVEIELAGNIYPFWSKAEFKVKRDGFLQIVMAKDLRTGDEILFDNRDILWTLNELRK